MPGKLKLPATINIVKAANVRKDDELLSKNNKSDLSGKRFGRLLVIDRSEKKSGKQYWNCICDCGKAVSVRSDSLTSYRTQSCGCLQKENVSKSSIDDLRGKTFGRLTVVGIDETSSNPVKWLCKCNCGNPDIISVSAKLLTSSRKKSCGCLQQEFRNKPRPEKVYYLVGERYGRLTVIDFYKKINGEYFWTCKCECGNITHVSSANLRNKHTQSCGCINSKGEELISKILTDNCIAYRKQYSFEDLLNDNGNKMRFDFAVLDQNQKPLYLIEFDGIHHYKARTSGWNTDENLIKTKHDDALKDKYCAENGIYLLRIPYYEFQNIDLNMLIPMQYREILSIR